VDGFYRDALAEGFGRKGAVRTAEDFEVAATVPVIIHDDVEEAASFLRPVLALYIGGMGAREVNFHANVFGRMGYESEARAIQDLYLEGKKDEAAALVPMSLIEETALIGPKEKIRDDLEAWRESVVTTLQVYGDPATLRSVAELVFG
jgi:alkanesulfonate monooxygenase SsuD/methylene tetrahydromethanopterin reductase-like flavin-dependent oxidoreductase (luciferase family)